MKKKSIEMPKFVNEDEEATWWASRQGRQFLKQKSEERSQKGRAPKGSRLVRELNRPASH